MTTFHPTEAAAATRGTTPVRPRRRRPLRPGLYSSRPNTATAASSSASSASASSSSAFVSSDLLATAESRPRWRWRLLTPFYRSKRRFLSLGLLLLLLLMALVMHHHVSNATNITTRIIMMMMMMMNLTTSSGRGNSIDRLGLFLSSSRITNNNTFYDDPPPPPPHHQHHHHHHHHQKKKKKNWKDQPDSLRLIRHPSPPPPTVIFFHMYAHPTNLTWQQHAWRIITQQLNQVATSYLATTTTTTTTTFSTSVRAWGDNNYTAWLLPVFFITVGDTHLASRVQEYCQQQQNDLWHPLNSSSSSSSTPLRRRLDCIHLAHYPDGYEERTLQHVYEYCHRQGPESSSSSSSAGAPWIVYLHSRGSFHPSAGAERWRPASTAAVTSAACHSARDTSYHQNYSNLATASCNACGLTFSPVWTLFYPGNIWTASCELIRQLVPPARMAHQMTEAARRWQEYRRQGILSSFFPQQHLQEKNDSYYGLYPSTTDDYGDKPDYLGLGRWGAEHWLSHPDLRPCDVADPPFYWHHKPGIVPATKDTMAGRVQPAPRFSVIDQLFHVKARHRDAVLSQATPRFREPYFLAGQLLKWHVLYNTSPVHDSWIWDWFPDGHVWQRAVQLHGLPEAIQVLTAHPEQNEAWFSASCYLESS